MLADLSWTKEKTAVDERIHSKNYDMTLEGAIDAHEEGLSTRWPA